MYHFVKNLMYTVRVDEPDPLRQHAARAIQELSVDHAAKAVRKADELFGIGLENVTITDTKTGRKYRHEEFPSIVERKRSKVLVVKLR